MRELNPSKRGGIAHKKKEVHWQGGGGGGTPKKRTLISILDEDLTNALPPDAAYEMYREWERGIGLARKNDGEGKK